MNGHGHVVPNADGSKARCGGPSMCSQCASELSKQRGIDPGLSASISDRFGGVDFIMKTISESNETGRVIELESFQGRFFGQELKLVLKIRPAPHKEKREGVEL